MAANTKATKRSLIYISIYMFITRKPDWVSAFQRDQWQKISVVKKKKNLDLWDSFMLSHTLFICPVAMSFSKINTSR